MLKSFRGVFSMSHPQLGYFIVEMREELVRQQERAVELLNLPETAADVNANAKQSTSKATAAAAFSQIQANDPTAAEGDRKALEAKHQMQLYLDAHNVNNEIFVPIEVNLRLSKIRVVKIYKRKKIELSKIKIVLLLTGHVFVNLTMKNGQKLARIC